MIRIKVQLNGTDENPFKTLYGLKQNPFPQIGEYKYRGLDNLLNNLAAEPIRDTDHLRERMKGASQEFIDGCCERFQKGKIVSFIIEFAE
jgi:hypothetical protein